MGQILGGSGKGEKALDPKDFDGEVLIGTISEKPKAIQTEGRKRWVVRFAEYPKQPYYCGIQQLTGLVKQLGNDDDTWVGQRAALYVNADVDNPTTGGKVSKWYPMDPQEARQLLLDTDAAKAAEAAKAAAPAAGGRKRGKQ